MARVNALVKPAGHIAQEKRSYAQADDKLIKPVVSFLDDCSLLFAPHADVARKLVRDEYITVEQALTLAFDPRIRRHRNAYKFGFFLSRVYNFHNPKWIVQGIDLPPYECVFQDFGGVVVNLGHIFAGSPNYAVSLHDEKMIFINGGALGGKVTSWPYGVYMDESVCRSYRLEFKTPAKARRLIRSVVACAKSDPTSLDDRFGTAIQPMIDVLKVDVNAVGCEEYYKIVRESVKVIQ